MGALETLLQYIRESERLVVVTLTVTVAGLALFAGERWQGGLFDFRGLPEWVRPAAVGVWTVCGVHVAIRTVMVFWKGATAAARYTAGIPQRRRRAAYERPIIKRLRATDGVEREVLCYVLYQDHDRFWVPWTGEQPPRWLQRLIAKGLVEKSDTRMHDIQFRIHRVAWAYMQKYPHKFQNLVGWPAHPWTLDEDGMEKKIREIKARPGPRRFEFFASRAPPSGLRRGRDLTDS
jgi:hypothetical protein